MEPADVKEKVGTWLNQLPKNYRYDNSYSSSVDDNESVKGKRNKDDANGREINATSLKVEHFEAVEFTIQVSPSPSPKFKQDGK